jgi:hypothetical protein
VVKLHQPPDASVVPKVLKARTCQKYVVEGSSPLRPALVLAPTRTQGLQALSLVVS